MITQPWSTPAQPKRENANLPAHLLKAHRIPSGRECEMPAWEKVFSQADEHIGWLCRCGATETVDGRCGKAGCALFRHSGSCKRRAEYIEKRVKALRTYLAKIEGRAAKYADLAARSTKRIERATVALERLRAKGKETAVKEKTLRLAKATLSRASLRAEAASAKVKSITKQIAALGAVEAAA